MKKSSPFRRQPMEGGSWLPPSIPSPLLRLSFFFFFSCYLSYLYEVFCVSSEVLSTSSEVLSLSRKNISPSSTTSRSVSAFFHCPRPWIHNVSEDFGFDFLKIRSVIFRKLKPQIRPSTVISSPSAANRHKLCHHPTITRRRVAHTRPRVDLTLWRVAHTYRRILRSSATPLCFRSFLVFPNISPASSVSACSSRTYQSSSASAFDVAVFWS